MITRKILLLMAMLFFVGNVYAQDQKKSVFEYIQSDSSMIPKESMDATESTGNYKDCYQQLYNDLSLQTRNDIELYLNIEAQTSTFSKNSNDLNFLKGTDWGFLVSVSGELLTHDISIANVVKKDSAGDVYLDCEDSEGLKGQVWVLYGLDVSYLEDPCFYMAIDEGSMVVLYWFNVDNGLASGACMIVYDTGTQLGPYEVLGVKVVVDPDNDGDGYTVGEGDCNDSNKNINPGATENCSDRIDNDCDGKVDCNDTDCTDDPVDPACQVCTDADGDGYYAESDCDGEVDCNDGDSSIHPGAIEIRDDGVDQNCDGKDDKELDIDDDKDGYTENQEDCNDYNSSIHPGATEIRDDGIDQNCDGKDEIERNIDDDGDGYTENQGDCDDYNSSIHPGVTEICDDSKDNNCNGTVDEGCTPPTANAGADQKVKSGDLIILDGSGSTDSDGTIASYLWSQTGSSPTVALSQNNVVNPTFTAPSVTQATTLTFQLTVEDNSGKTSTDSVNITVNKASGGGGGGCFISNIVK